MLTYSQRVGCVYSVYILHFTDHSTDEGIILLISKKSLAPYMKLESCLIQTTAASLLRGNTMLQSTKDSRTTPRKTNK